ncbi:MAG TPA: peptidylprolyl isomerase, partial [Planctomycetota bacterium]|nr:peptidylprolyl isomerase [Planctomycetota bacterium]
EIDQLLMQRAQALVDRAHGGENFESIVRAESNDLAVRKNGGLLPDEEWRLRGAAFVQAVEAAERGVVQPPVANSSGIDVFLVQSRETTKFEDVREQLKRELRDEAPSLDEITALEKGLRASSQIEPVGR